MEDMKGKGIVEYSDSTDWSDEYDDGDDGLWDEVESEGNDYEEKVLNDEMCRNGDIHVTTQLDYSKLTYAQILGREFITLEDAESFYLEYARQVGFAIRKESFKKFSDGVPRLRIFVCQREGKRRSEWSNLSGRKRNPRPDFRVNCPAKFQVNFDRSKNRWFVKKFVQEHSHELVKYEHVNFLRSHRNIDESTKAEINSLRKGGVQTSHIVNVLAMQSGGYSKMGFQRKDVYNHVQLGRSLDPPNGDINGVLCYFTGKKANDPGFYYNNTVEADACMGNLFWADSVSRYDYACFGDVIAFDSAFKRNRYDRPLVVIVGVNHHHQTIIFACAIIVKENAANYSWLLNQLVECMGGKKPLSVVTDGDLSMGKAIREVMPEATHRLCSFHLQRNAACHVKIRGFVHDFSKLMFRRVDVERFELEWEKLIESYNLSENGWVNELYEKRTMWAEAYLKGKFFAGTRTTSRCESMHSSFDKVIGRRLSFNEFVQKFEKVLATIRHKETQLDHESEYGKPVCRTPFREFELPASSVYTSTSFNIFQEQLAEAGAYKDFGPPIFEDDKVTFLVARYNSVNEFRIVVLTSSENKLWCSCELMQSTGFPCRHLLYCMKRELFPSLPPYLISKRWTKEAKTSPSTHPIAGNSATKTFMEDIRFGHLCTSFRALCSMACQREETYSRVKEDIARSSRAISDVLYGRPETTKHTKWDNCVDPKRPNKRVNSGDKKFSERKCSMCKGPGHNKNKCHLLTQSTSCNPTMTAYMS